MKRGYMNWEELMHEIRVNNRALIKRQGVMIWDVKQPRTDKEIRIAKHNHALVGVRQNFAYPRKKITIN